MKKNRKMSVMLLAMLLVLAQILCQLPGTLAEEAPEEAPAAPVAETLEPVQEPPEAEEPAAVEAPVEVLEEQVEPVAEELPEEAEAIPAEAPAPEPEQRVAEPEAEVVDPTVEASAETAAEAAQAVRVTFAGDPADASVRVYPAATAEDPEPAAIAAEADGSYLLLPGAYVYSAAAEGYEALERMPFTVGSGEEQMELRFALFAAVSDEAELPEDADILAESAEEYAALPDAAADNDALFEEYIKRTLPGLNGGGARLLLRRAAVNAGRANLTGASATLYDLLRPLVADVAAGRRTATRFKFTAADFGLENVAWTKDDLGLDSLTKTTASGSTITSDAIHAMFAKTGISTDAVLHALLSDCAYDLYWFDKQTGMSTSYSCSIDQTGELKIGLKTVTIVMAAARDYATDNASLNDSGVHEQVDANLPARVNNAAANITRIVQANADKGDYQKLVSYKDEICSLVSYNTTALSIDVYGDPWQLVYVFDGDASTNVVCEGYSKAFMYLCEQSSFVSARVGCILVTGTMSGGTGAGRHMWNIVSMPDGCYYLVDVTNSDSGTAGADGQLFLKGWTSHDSAAVYVYKTRSAGGSTTYTFDDTVFSTYGSDSPWLKLAAADYSDAAPVSASISFAANGGSGSMAASTVEAGTAFTLPACGFAAPANCEFAGWQVDGEGSALFAPGESLVIRDNTLVTAVWKELPRFTQYTLLLSGRIGVNFYLKLPGGKDEYAGRTVDFTLNGKTTQVPVEEGVQDSTTVVDEYRYVCYINSVQMADVITVKFVYGGKTDATAQGSAAGYIQAIQSNTAVSASVRQLAAALADYGSYAQAYLSQLRGWTVGEGKDHAAMTANTASFDLAAIKGKVAGAAVTGALGDSGVTKVTQSLTLDSETTINFFLYAVDDFSQDVTYTVTAGGKTVASGTAVRTRKGRWQISLPGVSAHELGTVYTVTANTGKGEVRVSGSALSYVNTVLSASDSYGAGAAEAVAALYNYYAAAAAALGSGAGN